MSVRKIERKQNLLQVLQLSNELVIYTIRTCHNEKFFKKRYYNETAKVLIDISRLIMQKTLIANSIDLYQNYEQRYKLQQQALLFSKLFTNYVIICSSGLGLPQDKALKFQTFIDEWKKLCQQWIKSDKQRLKDKNKSDDEKVLG